MSFPTAEVERMAVVQPLSWTEFSVHRCVPPPCCRCLTHELLTWSPGARKCLVAAQASFQDLNSLRQRIAGKRPLLSPYEPATRASAKVCPMVCPIADQGMTLSTTAPLGSTDRLADSQSITSGSQTGPAPLGSTNRLADSQSVGTGQLCKCMSWHCKNSQGQHRERAPDSGSFKRHERPPCTGSAFPGSHYCLHCKCQSDGCPHLQYSSDMCRTHWHRSEGFSPEWRIIIDLGDMLAEVEPPDLQMFQTLSWSLPYPALVIASQMWEPLPVETFCREVKNAVELGKDWRGNGAKILLRAFRLAVAHSHRLLKSDDADHHRCLEILAFGGVARHFGTLSLGRRLGCIQTAPEGTADEQTFQLGLERSTVVFTPCLARFQDMVNNLPHRLSKPKDNSQLSQWIAKLDTDLRSIGPWACHGDKRQRSPSYKKLHSLRKLFILMATRHPDDFGALSNPSGWLGWSLSPGQTSWGILEQLSPDSKGYLQSLPSYARNFTFLSRVGNPLMATMRTCLVGQALNDDVAAKSSNGVRVREAVLRWHRDGTLRDRFRQALDRLKAIHTHSHVYHVFKEALAMESKGQQ